MKKLAILSALLIGSLTLANAQTRTLGINEKQRNGQARIHQGERSGQLTPREANRLEHNQNVIAHEKRVAKADGFVTPAERRQINHDLNREDKNIYHEKHDRQRRHRARY